ncbi:MAG: nucleotidyltransferase domain-containing protein [Actinomycetota bacterium]
MVTHWVDEEGRYDGRRLGDWLDEVVRDVVTYADPVEVIVFGSVARGDDGPDSDIDLLVTVPEFEPGQRHLLMGRIRAAISAPVPIDVFVTTPEEFAKRRDVPGSVLYWPAREGKVVYERAA